MNWYKELKVLLALGGLCKTRKNKMKTGVELIAIERQEQIEKTWFW